MNRSQSSMHHVLTRLLSSLEAAASNSTLVHAGAGGVGIAVSPRTDCPPECRRDEPPPPPLTSPAPHHPPQQQSAVPPLPPPQQQQQQHSSPPLQLPPRLIQQQQQYRRQQQQQQVRVPVNGSQQQQQQARSESPVQVPKLRSGSTSSLVVGGIAGEHWRPTVAYVEALSSGGTTGEQLPRGEARTLVHERPHLPPPPPPLLVAQRGDEHEDEASAFVCDADSTSDVDDESMHDQVPPPPPPPPAPPVVGGIGMSGMSNSSASVAESSGAVLSSFVLHRNAAASD